MTPLQQSTATVLAAMQQVGLSEEMQVQTLTSCLIALCCARSNGPGPSHILIDVVSRDMHERVDDAWRLADPILVAMRDIQGRKN